MTCYLAATRTPSASRSRPDVATRSPARSPLGDLDPVADRLPGRRRCALRRGRAAITNTRAVPATVRTAAAGTSNAGRGAGLFDAGGGEEPGLQPAVGLATTASTIRARGVGVDRRRHVAHLAGEGLAGIRIHLEVDAAAGGHLATRTAPARSARRAAGRPASPRPPWCPWSRSRPPRRAVRRPRRWNGARTTVSATAFCARLDRAPGPPSATGTAARRRWRRRRTDARPLRAGRSSDRTPTARCSWLLCSVSARSNSVRARRRLASALATSGTRSTSNAAPPAMPSRASICAALASASRAWASTSAAEMRIRSALAADAAAALHRRRDDAAGDLGGDLGLFLRGERAADAE